MPRRIGLIVGAFALVELGWICGSMADSAVAQEPPPAAPAATHMLCKAFAGAADRPGVVDTSDATTEVGQWVAEATAKGWAVDTVDFEVGVKPTGYPQPWVEVCLTR